MLVTVVISVLSVLAVILLGLLIYPSIKIKIRQLEQKRRKVTIYHGTPVVGLCHPKPDESIEILRDESGRIISIDGIPFDEFMARL